ncbi:CAP domain-containing protein [Actinosynnema sp. NPDC020468]|uniref:CAP domain-containing protein n=1 Tax=Actinosynnema sp. NPDC020468 TaxID=3154488 RepID=UPI0033C6A4EE
MTPRMFAAGVAVAALLTATGTAHAAPTQQEDVLTLTNKERVANKCPELKYNKLLENSAQGHTTWMAQNGNMNHTGLNDSTPSQRIDAAGYKWKMAGENIAFGQKDAAAVVTAWMNSPVHRANILNCGFRELGVGYALDAKKKVYWTQNFGTM